jgi:hypothetical protein
MPAYASFETPDVALARDSSSVGVYRYNPRGSSKYEYLPNVRVLGICHREGPNPGTARFRYVFDPADPSTDPTSFQQALAVDCSLSNVVKNDERLVVFKDNPDGTAVPLFDGFAQVPELSLSPSQELVTFVAYGVAVREWDTPIAGALVRDSDDPMTAHDVATDLETYFNPEGKPNATPLGADARDTHGNTFPTFLDPLVIRAPDVRRKWTLPMAVRYLCFLCNAEQSYVANPSGKLVDSLLDSRSPIAGVTMDPADPTTYKSQPILAPDYPVTGKPWPAALHALLEPNGFGMVFRLEADASGDPVTSLELFRRQDASLSSYKDLFLQPSGDPLDPSRSNLAQASLARDTTSVANIYTVASRMIRYECSFVLAPGFAVAPADAFSAASIREFDRSSPTYSPLSHDKYRLYIFDETGEGHWDFESSELKQAATSLSALFVDDAKKSTPWVKRRRVPSGELLSLDSNRKPLKARLAISTDYTGGKPGLWDGTGTWQPVAGGFDLLNDRLGVWVNVPNPNGWNIGASATPGLPYPTGVVRGVEDQANTSATHFTLRLTCVIEGDQAVKATAGQRPSSATVFPIMRRIYAGDRYSKHVVAPRSEFNPTPEAVIVCDETDEANAEACARRLAGEAGEVAGSAVIPRFTNAYRIGDKIRSIQGRDLSLRTNAGAPLEEGEVFPTVVGVAWDFDGGQRTVLQLSDHRGERP